MIAYTGWSMINAPADRFQGVPNRPGGGGKSAQKAKKILNRGNEPKDLLKTQELAFSGAQDELVFHRPRRQSRVRIRLKIDDLWGIERKRELEIGKWKLATGNWKLEIRNCACQFLISNF